MTGLALALGAACGLLLGCVLAWLILRSERRWKRRILVAVALRRHGDTLTHGELREATGLDDEQLKATVEDMIRRGQIARTRAGSRDEAARSAKRTLGGGAGG